MFQQTLLMAVSFLCFGLGIILFGMLLLTLLRSDLGETKANRMPATCDLLDYATLADDHVIVLKSGGLLTQYELIPPRFTTMSENQMEHVYATARKALLKLSGNYCIQVDLLRTEDPAYLPELESQAGLMPEDKEQGSHQDSPDVTCTYTPGTRDTLLNLEAARRRYCTAHQALISRLILSITYIGSDQKSGKISRMVTDTPENAPSAPNHKDTAAPVTTTKDTAATTKDSIGTSSDNNSIARTTVSRFRHSFNQRLSRLFTSTSADTARIGSCASAKGAASSDCSSCSDFTLLSESESLRDKSLATAAARAALKSSAPKAAVSYVAEDSGRLSSEEALAVTQKMIDEFKQACTAAAASLELYFEVRPLGSTYDARCGLLWHEGLSHINQCLTGNFQKIALPRTECYLDAILGNCDFIHGFLPKAGTNFVSVIALEGLPTGTNAGLLNALATLPFPYRFNTRFICFDQLKSSFLLSKYRRFWAQKSRGILAQIFNLPDARVNQNALDQIADLDQAKRALDNNEVIFGSYTAVLLLYSDTPEEALDHTQTALKAIEHTGLTGRVESLNATEAFLGSLPGHYFENLRRPMISHDVLLDLLPLRLPATGEPACPNPLMGTGRSSLMQVRTDGRSNYLLNLHLHDLGHTLVVGPPGAGKSVLLGSLMLNMLRYQHMRVFAFDKGCSFYALTRALCGQHIRFSSNQALFCPLSDLETDRECSYALNFLESLLQSSGLEVSPEQRNELMECLSILQDSPKNHRSLSDFYLLLNSPELKETLSCYLRNGDNAQAAFNTVLDAELKGSEKNTVSTADTYSAPGANRKDHSCLLDAADNMRFGQHSITTFECAELFEAPRHLALPVLKQVFHLMEQQFNGEPAAILLDEAWLMLQDPDFAKELLKWFKTLRKFNVAVILATQSLSDLEHSELFAHLLDCAKTRFFLPNADATSKALAPIYQMMGLTDQEINIIAHSQPKSDYYFVKGQERLTINLLLPELERHLLSVAGDHMCPVIDHLYEIYGVNFYAHLKELLPTSEQTRNHAGCSVSTTCQPHTIPPSGSRLHSPDLSLSLPETPDVPRLPPHGQYRAPNAAAAPSILPNSIVAPHPTAACTSVLGTGTRAGAGTGADAGAGAGTGRTGTGPNAAGICTDAPGLCRSSTDSYPDTGCTSFTPGRPGSNRKAPFPAADKRNAPHSPAAAPHHIHVAQSSLPEFCRSFIPSVTPYHQTTAQQPDRKYHQ